MAIINWSADYFQRKRENVWQFLESKVIFFGLSDQQSKNSKDIPSLSQNHKKLDKIVREITQMTS